MILNAAIAGLLPEQAYYMTLEELSIAIEGGKIRNERAWEQTRLIVSVIHNGNCSKAHQRIKPQDVIKLSFDDKNPVEFEKIPLREAKKYIGNLKEHRAKLLYLRDSLLKKK